jgi:ABC-type sugar transport system ATPase subunit
MDTLPCAGQTIYQRGREHMAATAAVGAATIEVEDLYVSYGDLVAVKGVSFDVRTGECFGLLGPNGAGKTSTLRLCQ